MIKVHWIESYETCTKWGNLDSRWCRAEFWVA